MATLSKYMSRGKVANAMTYQVLDTASANVLATFARRSDALAFVLEFIEDNGVEVADDLALGAIDPEGNPHRDVEGRDLLTQARAQALTPA